jgi:hypothetical protein
MLRDIEDQKFNFNQENQDDEANDNGKIVLPTNERLCFNPHPDDIEQYDYSSQEPEPERYYTFTEEFKKACKKVYDFIKKKEYHRKNDLCHYNA